MNVEPYRRRLLALERYLLQRLGREVETAQQASDDQPAPEDLSRIDELKDEYFALAATDTDILWQVRAALERIENGTFGQCIVDGGPIEPKRLDAVPWTPYCLAHQVETEARRRTPTL
jgi:DnaK suppressor protein